VILIAITLVAATAMAGFVFGVFGTFTSTARVTAGEPFCRLATGQCVLTVINVGTSNVDLLTGQNCASITYGGVHVLAATCAGDGGNSIVAGGSLRVTLNFPANFGGAPVVEQQLSGYVAMANSATIPFAGVFRS